jgi:hypothetical protein
MFRGSLTHHQRAHICTKQSFTIKQLGAFVGLNYNKSEY